MTPMIQTMTPPPSPSCEGFGPSYTAHDQTEDHGFARALESQTESHQVTVAIAKHDHCKRTDPSASKEATLTDAAMQLLKKILGTSCESAESPVEVELESLSSGGSEFTAIDDVMDSAFLSAVAATVVPVAIPVPIEPAQVDAELTFDLPVSAPVLSTSESPLLPSQVDLTLPLPDDVGVDPVVLASVSPISGAQEITVETEEIALDEIAVPETDSETETETSFEDTDETYESSRLEHRSGPLHAAVTPAQPAQPNHGGPATRAIPANPSKSREVESVQEINTESTPHSLHTAGASHFPVTQLTKPDATLAANPVSEAPQSAPAPAPAPAEQIVTVLEPLRHVSTGTYELLIELQPEELGRVEVRVEMRNGVMHAHLRAEQPAAAQAIRDAVNQLRDHLTAFGVQTGAINVDAGGTGRRHGPQGSAPEPNNRRDERNDNDSAASNRRRPALKTIDPDRIDTRA